MPVHESSWKTARSTADRARKRCAPRTPCGRPDSPARTGVETKAPCCPWEAGCSVCARRPFRGEAPRAGRVFAPTTDRFVSVPCGSYLRLLFVLAGLQQGIHLFIGEPVQTRKEAACLVGEMLASWLDCMPAGAFGIGSSSFKPLSDFGGDALQAQSSRKFTTVSSTLRSRFTRFLSSIAIRESRQKRFRGTPGASCVGGSRRTAAARRANIRST